MTLWGPRTHTETAMSEVTMRTHTPAPGRFVIEVHGSLDDPTMAALRSALVGLLHEPAWHIILDLHHVTVLDAVGVGTVIAGCEALDDLGKTVQVHAAEHTLTTLRAGGIAERSLATL